MDAHHSFITSDKDTGARLDIFLSRKSGSARTKVYGWVKAGQVELNRKVITKRSIALHSGDIVKVNTPKITASVRKLKSDAVVSVNLVVREETDDYLVIEKPAGILTHPITDTKTRVTLASTPTVAGWIVREYPKLWGVGEYANRPGIVHRLDKETSGLLVVAKNQQMFEALKDQFKKRSIEKYYWALVHGKVAENHGTIAFAIDRGASGRMVSRPKVGKITLKNVAKLQHGKEAATEFWVEKRLVNFSLMNIQLHTGRTHQIRVHFFAYNHPVVGDPLYRNKKLNSKYDTALGRIFLHAYRICFNDLNGERHCFESKLPDELANFIRKFN